jgi:DedD protein
VAAQFKNRLIGTIALVALLVIVIPDVLDGKKERVTETFNAIPFAPEPAALPPLVIELDPIDDQAGSTAQHTQTSAQASGSAPEVNGDAKPVVVEIAPTRSHRDQIAAKAYVLETKTPHIDNNAWIIQLATFKSADRTNALVAKLRQAGYQAHSYPMPAVDDSLNRVFVGPDVSKKAMENKLVELKKMTKLDGMLRRFDPLTRN